MMSSRKKRKEESYRELWVTQYAPSPIQSNQCSSEKTSENCKDRDHWPQKIIRIKHISRMIREIGSEGRACSVNKTKGVVLWIPKFTGVTWQLDHILTWYSNGTSWPIFTLYEMMNSGILSRCFEKFYGIFLIQMIYFKKFPWRNALRVWGGYNMMCYIKYILYTMHMSSLPFQNLWVASTLSIFFLASFPSFFFF